MSDEVSSLYQKHVPGLKRGSGANWSGCCPLHGEVPGKSRPSFCVNIETGLWICYAGCGAGNIPQFLRALGKNRDQIDAVLDTVKPTLRTRTSRRPRASSAEELVTTIPEKLLGLFDACPTELLEAGFEESVLYDHDVGFDRTRNRITYAIRDLSGTLVGIMGRNAAGYSGKYLPYMGPELGIPNYKFEKVQHLWRGDKVYATAFHATSKDPIYVVEGFKAALWLVQNGYENTVALMGSSISAAQVAILERIGNPVILFLDNDRAGRDGTQRAGYKLSGLRVLAVPYPDEAIKQPDDFDPAGLREALNETCSLGRWKQHEQRSDASAQ
jgi:DNA primase